VGDDQCVAVGRGLGADSHADDARRAAAIIDHDLLAERGAKLVGNDARDRIDAAAGREGHDHRDRAHRIFRFLIRPGAEDCRGYHCRQRDRADRASVTHGRPP
jgi:hypothetical protein